MQLLALMLKFRLLKKTWLHRHQHGKNGARIYPLHTSGRSGMLCRVGPWSSAKDARIEVPKSAEGVGCGGVRFPNGEMSGEEALIPPQKVFGLLSVKLRLQGPLCHTRA